MPRRLYLFLDEGGNFDFSVNGTCHYSITCVTKERNFMMYPELDNYKYDVIEFGKDIDHFHCTEDNPHVRARVFGIIQASLSSLKIDSIIVRKCKTGISLQDPAKFYSKMIGYLIRHVISRYDITQIEEVIVITDTLPVKRSRETFQKTIKLTLASMLPVGASYRVLHHASRAHYGLQVADYCNWAIFRKWENGDDTHYRTIRPALRSEFDIFRSGTTRYYNDGRPL